MTDPLITRLVIHRRQRHLSQSQVAQMMGTKQSHVSDLEGGNLDPRLSTLRRYAQALDVDLVFKEETE